MSEDNINELPKTHKSKRQSGKIVKPRKNSTLVKKSKMSESLESASDDDVEQPELRNGEKRVRVELIDGEHITLDIDEKWRGRDLLDMICNTLKVTEKDYFGLLLTQRGDTRTWVDLYKRLAKTFKDEPWDVRLAFRFYPRKPAEINNDVTRHQLTFAVRRDLVTGRLTCSQSTYALLSSYILQAELGDYEGQLTPSMLATRRSAPLSAVTPELDAEIEKLYKSHKGQTPAEAELNFLENAKRLPFFGAELHPALDSENGSVVLAICAGGISIYSDGLLMNRFPWAKILRISYHKREFTLKLRRSEIDEYDPEPSFTLPSTAACENLWQCGLDHHVMFRRDFPREVHRFQAVASFGSQPLSSRQPLEQVHLDIELRPNPIPDPTNDFEYYD